MFPIYVFILFSGQSFTPQPLTVSERRPDPSGAAAVGHEDINLLPAPSPRDILALVQAVMSETLVRAVGAVYEFSLSGANGGVYYLDLKHGRFILYPSKHRRDEL